MFDGNGSNGAHHAPVGQQDNPSFSPEPDRSLPDTPRSPYAPGPFRAALDAAQSAVAAFTGRHPEYSKLSFEETLQALDQYRTADEHRERELLAHEGVDPDWVPNPESDEPRRWSDYE